jgi:hypothetical protein
MFNATEATFQAWALLAGSRIAVPARHAWQAPAAAAAVALEQEQALGGADGTAAASAVKASRQEATAKERDRL